jgi:4-amino-4-deoxy-L-arabinose transferase-like glycosyltransferase
VAVLQRAGTLLAAHPRVLAALLLVTLVGGGLRAQAAAAPSRYQSVDERAYARLARTLADRWAYGDGVMRDPVRWPPGAPVVFAAVHEVRPAVRGDGSWDVPSAYPVQAAAGTVTIPLTFALAALAAGPVAGLLAATAFALYPPAIRSTGELLTEPLGTMLLVGCLLAVALALARPRALVGAGLLVGLAVLVRGDLVALPFLLALVVGVLVRHAGAPWRTVMLASAALVAGALVALVPWSIIASNIAGRVVPVTSGGGSNLFVGTYLPGDGSMFKLKRTLADDAKRRFPRYRDTADANVPQRIVLDAVAARHPELGRDAALRREALANLRRYALGQPLDFGAMLARKVGRLWLGVSRGTHRNVPVGVTALHLALVGLAAPGLLAALALGPRRPVLWLAFATLLYITAVNAVFVAEPRHNLPVMPVLLAAGAGAGVLLAGRLAPQPARRVLRTNVDYPA